MKRKRQVEIVLDALSACGVDMTDDIKNAVCKALNKFGLRNLPKISKANGR